MPDKEKSGRPMGPVKRLLLDQCLTNEWQSLSDIYFKAVPLVPYEEAVKGSQKLQGIKTVDGIIMRGAQQVVRKQLMDLAYRRADRVQRRKMRNELFFRLNPDYEEVSSGAPVSRETWHINENILADGKWHSIEELIDKCRHLVHPAVAVRENELSRRGAKNAPAERKKPIDSFELIYQGMRRLITKRMRKLLKSATVEETTIDGIKHYRKIKSLSPNRKPEM